MRTAPVAPADASRPADISRQLQFGGVGVGGAASVVRPAREVTPPPAPAAATQAAPAPQPATTSARVVLPVGAAADAATMVDNSDYNFRYRPLPFDVTPAPPGYREPDPLAPQDDAGTRIWIVSALVVLFLLVLGYGVVMRAGNAAPVAQEFESRGGWRRRRRRIVGVEPPAERLPRRAA